MTIYMNYEKLIPIQTLPSLSQNAQEKNVTEAETQSSHEGNSLQQILFWLFLAVPWLGEHEGAFFIGILSVLEL